MAVIVTDAEPELADGAAPPAAPLPLRLSHSRTGMPRCAMRALAWATVYSP